LKRENHALLSARGREYFKKSFILSKSLIKGCFIKFINLDQMKEYPYQNLFLKDLKGERHSRA
jgi:hypothetical protein